MSDESDLIPPGWLKLSNSAVGIYESCPLRYRFNYIDKIYTEPPPKRPLLFGNSLHSAVKGFFSQPDRSLDFLLKLGESAHEAEYYIDDNAVVPGAVAIADRQELRQQLENIWNLYRDEDTLNAPSRTELEFYFPVHKLKVMLHGHIDHIYQHPDNRNELVDYKSGSWRYTQTDVDLNRQLTIYSFYAECKGVKVDLCSIYMTRHNLKLSSSRTALHYSELLETLAAVSSGIRAEKFEARPGPDTCKWCQFTTVCRPYTDWQHQKKGLVL